MGNDVSILSECFIDDTPILRTPDWTLHHAQRDEETLSVFISNKDESRLKQLEEKVKVYRHPCIIRYVHSCKYDGKLYLFTEKVSPLSIVLKQQVSLQKCLGLRNVLQALEFLHTRGSVCHNNVCQAAIFVNAEGKWKLGGMELLMKFDEINESFLKSSRPFRYEPAIPLEETTGQIKDHSARDVFAFGVLVEEVLNEERDISGVDSLRSLARNRITSREPQHRPSVQEIIDQPYFKQDFVAIIDFLTDLPVKSVESRSVFYRDLTSRLFSLPPEVVAAHLSPLLLARVVLLDEMAARTFIPDLLTPAGTGERSPYDPEQSVNPILPDPLFKEYVAPILQKIFHVRDVQIRFVLLSCFSEYCAMFRPNILEDDILPQLLLGMKDTNEEMVAATLRALADLIPILGAKKVVGKNRKKIFHDGAPGKALERSRQTSGMEVKKTVLKEDRTVISEKAPLSKRLSSSAEDLPLATRRSPIGAENSEAESNSSEWGWESEERSLKTPSPTETPQQPPPKATSPTKQKPWIDVDIEKLDIKVSAPSPAKSEVDFFADMEPVIERKPSILEEVAIIEEKKSPTMADRIVKEKADRFAVADNDLNIDEGWGDDGWGDVDL